MISYILINTARRTKPSILPLRKLCTTSPLEATTTSSGQILPMPEQKRFGLLGVVCAVIPGLLIGATISKKMANFLEETELFIPADDDDDDDD